MRRNNYLHVNAAHSETVSAALILLYSIFMLPLMYEVFRNKELSLPVLVILISSTLIIGFFIKRICAMGLYVYDKQILIKGMFKTRSIDIKSIAGIKITQVYVASGRGSYSPLMSLKGEVFFSAILLNSVTGEMRHHQKGDLEFIQRFNKYVICSVSYQKEVIEYLKKLNPRIRII